MKMNYAIKTMFPNRGQKKPFPWMAPAMIALLSIILAGCATAPKAPPKKYIYFPGPPDPPRLQYLTSYNSEKEVTGGTSHFAQFITGQQPTDYVLGKPYGLAFYQNKIYVCDSVLHGIVVLDLANHKVAPVNAPEEGAFVEPLNITIDTDGVRYVTDDVRDQVICLDSNNQFKWILGKKDEMKPRDVAVSGDRIFVADIQGHCVRVYDKASRQPLYTIPREKEATNVAAHLFLPTNLAADSNGKLYVSDTGAGRVEVYDAQGYYIRTLGGFGDDPSSGTLKRPKGVALDREGNVYVVDAAYQVVQMYDRDGRYLMWFGYPGDTAAALILPAKVVVDYDNVSLFQKFTAPNFKLDHLVLVTSQFGNRKISIYGFGSQK
jgi:DNA-binding beta-propeller fold protein YncE